MATKPIQTNPVADLPVNWTNGQTVAPTGQSVGLTNQHGYNYLNGKVNEALTDIGIINEAFTTTVPSPATTTPSAVGASGAVGSSTLYARADHVHKAPQAGTGNPKMDGTASAGSATTWSRSDHIHPSDTTRQGKITASGLLKGDGSGGVSANGTVTVAQGGTGATTVAAARNALGLGNTSGAVPIANGGTGATTAADARTNLGAAATSHTHAASAITSGTLPISRGGTGATTASAARTALGVDAKETWEEFGTVPSASASGTDWIKESDLAVYKKIRFVVTGGVMSAGSAYIRLYSTSTAPEPFILTIRGGSSGTSLSGKTFTSPDFWEIDRTYDPSGAVTTAEFISRASTANGFGAIRYSQEMQFSGFSTYPTVKLYGVRR